MPTPPGTAACGKLLHFSPRNHLVALNEVKPSASRDDRESLPGGTLRLGRHTPLTTPPKPGHDPGGRGNHTFMEGCRHGSGSGRQGRAGHRRQQRHRSRMRRQARGRGLRRHDRRAHRGRSGEAAEAIAAGQRPPGRDLRDRPALAAGLPGGGRRAEARLRPARRPGQQRRRHPERRLLQARRRALGGRFRAQVLFLRPPVAGALAPAQGRARARWST